MSRSKWYGKGTNKYALLTNQKRLLEEHFSFLTCKVRVKNNVLDCIGILQPDLCKDRYKVKVEQVAGKEPKVTVLSPVIEPSVEIHMYKDHSLCLHFPPDMPRNERVNTFEYTIPWISEWIIYYELYIVKGVWLGPQSPAHMKESDKNINVDTGNE